MKSLRQFKNYCCDNKEENEILKGFCDNGLSTCWYFGDDLGAFNQALIDNNYDKISELLTEAFLITVHKEKEEKENHNNKTTTVRTPTKIRLTEDGTIKVTYSVKEDFIEPSYDKNNITEEFEVEEEIQIEGGEINLILKMITELQLKLNPAIKRLL